MYGLAQTLNEFCIINNQIDTALRFPFHVLRIDATVF